MLPLISRPDTVTLDEVAFELVPPNHLDALANFASLHPILPFSLPPSLSTCQRIATLAWHAHRNAHQPQIPVRIAETQGSTARKRKRADQSDVLVISSDTAMISSTSNSQAHVSGNGGGGGGKKRRNPWSESVKLVLSQFMEGEDLNLETEGLEDMLVRLLK